MTMDKVTILAARSKNNIIGKNNTLPWRLPSDMKRFKKLTSGGIIIMGRKTFESLGSVPLPNRQNIVLSSFKGLAVPGGVLVCPTLELALEKALGASACLFRAPPVFVIGGAKVYRAALRVATHMILTTLDVECEGDTRFPVVDPWNWVWKHSEPFIDNEGWLLDNPSNKGITYSVETYERKL